MTAWFIAALVWRLLVFCFIVVFIARMVNGFRTRMTDDAEQARRMPAREILRRRFALGELTEAQYREMLAVLDAE